MTNNIDSGFVEAMHDVLGMDEDAVEALIDKLDADELQDLADAVADKDQAAAEAIVSQFNTDENVNSLFRGEHLKHAKSNKKVRRHDDDEQFAIGDDVMIEIIDKNGKKRSISATVEKPSGPEGTDTVVVRAKGKSIVVDKRKIDKLDEGVIGMIGLPNLQRIQQLAGIQAGASVQQEPVVQTTEVVNADPSDDSPMDAVMTALDALEAALPAIVLADLKIVRARLSALQASLNESVTALPAGRRKRD